MPAITPLPGTGAPGPVPGTAGADDALSRGALFSPWSGCTHARHATRAVVVVLHAYIAQAVESSGLLAQPFCARRTRQEAWGGRPGRLRSATSRKDCAW